MFSLVVAQNCFSLFFLSFHQAASSGSYMVSEGLAVTMGSIVGRKCGELVSVRDSSTGVVSTQLAERLKKTKKRPKRSFGKGEFALLAMSDGSLKWVSVVSTKGRMRHVELLGTNVEMDVDMDELQPVPP